jgi:hypothetical protein
VHLHPIQVVSQIVGISGCRTHDYQNAGKADQDPPPDMSTPRVPLPSTSAILSARLGTIDLLAERKQAGVIGGSLDLGASGPSGEA